MIQELLSEAERPHLLGVLPVIFEDDEAPRLKRNYETVTRSAMKADSHVKAPAFQDGVAINIVRANLENRLKHAKRDIYEIRDNTDMFTEYRREFLEVDSSDASPEDRANAFMTSRYLPNFEIYSRLVLGDNVGALNTKLAQRTLLLVASEFSTAEIVTDEPRVRPKVTRIIENNDGAFAVVKTKTDGLRVKVGGRMIDVKERRSGAVPIAELDEDDKRAFKVLANAAGHPNVTEDQVAPFRDRVRSYLGKTSHYYPVIERLYLSRPIDD